MVVAPTLLDGFVAEPPNAAHVKDHPLDSADVTLGIDAAGQYYLNKHAVDSATLALGLQSIFAAAREDKVLYLKADRDLDYSKVLSAIDIARNNGVGLIGMITRPPGAAHP